MQTSARARWYALVHQQLELITETAVEVLAVWMAARCSFQGFAHTTVPEHMQWLSAESGMVAGAQPLGHAQGPAEPVADC